MNKKQVLIASGVLFLVISLFFVYDTVCSYSEISKNNRKIEQIEAKKHDLERENAIYRQKMERFSKNPKAAEEILRMKYKMLRKDQYIQEK